MRKSFSLTLQDFRNTFYLSLSEIYPVQELNGIYGLLLDEYLKLSRVQAALEANKELSQKEVDNLTLALKRLIKNEPIQYILGYTYFFDLRIQVSLGVLIPRPESEELIQWILSDYKESDKALKAVDCGAGSGCLSLALKASLPNLQITALDVSDRALEVIELNKKALNLAISHEKFDILNDKMPYADLDFIVSNPPYVLESERELMRANVLDYEPDLALFVSDADPLIFYRKVLEHALESVKEEGSVYFEINEHFETEMIALAHSLGWKDSIVKKDMFGRSRMMRCRR